MSHRQVLTAVLLQVFSTLSASDTIAYDPGPNPPYEAAILVEVQSNAMLFAYNARQARSPASTQKLLLELVAMDLVQAGRVSLTDSVRVSARAARTGGSQVYLAQDEVFTLEELMAAIVIPSANDACVAVAEHLAGSVEHFVALMNHRAAELGLKDTRCVNVHGLDDTPLDNRNLTTAHDLAQIARALLAYPEVLNWSSIRRQPFRNGRYMLQNTNRLLGRFQGLDGLKTGYTRRAGSCLVATAQRDGMRLISVILGARSERVRERETARLLGWGFANFARVPLIEAGQSIGRVVLDWGLEPEVAALTQDTVTAVLSPGQEKLLKRHLDLPAQYPAPVRAGEKLGSLKITLGDSLVAQVHLVAEKSIGRMGWWEKIMSYF
jgi:D-alanyl-D-alanine carboxypeptidase (penicillin-binding protein 5/6)